MIDRKQLMADRASGVHGPWAYRPHKYDDWGLVRGGDDYPIASVSICRASDAEKNQHRVNKTDPAEIDARRIARVPELEAELIAQDAVIAELRQALGGLFDLYENGSPFGGEIYQDRVDRIVDRSRAALAKTTEAPNE